MASLLVIGTPALFFCRLEGSRVARRPHQFPHAYIQGMNCCVLHLPGILRETQDRRACKGLPYKQWKDLEESGEENSFKREMSGKTASRGMWTQITAVKHQAKVGLGHSLAPFSALPLQHAWVYLSRVYFCEYVLLDFSISSTMSRIRG